MRLDEGVAAACRAELEHRRALAHEAEVYVSSQARGENCPRPGLAAALVYRRNYRLLRRRAEPSSDRRNLTTKEKPTNGSLYGTTEFQIERGL
jgi:hypothetical protein